VLQASFGTILLSIFNPVMIPDKKSTDFNTNGASSIDIIFKHFYSSDDDVTVDQCLAEWNMLKYNSGKRLDMLSINDCT
jgi:hypothetical protein